MKRILVLGGGLVSGPMIEYLLGKGFAVDVADMDPSRVEKRFAGRPGLAVHRWGADDRAGLRELMGPADVVVSILPAFLHVAIAEQCIHERKSMVTASYVGPEMKELDARAKAAGILLLNEMGLDPGIDHMHSMRLIHSIRRVGGFVEGYRCYCGGLPAPDAKTTPWGYKFSWSPQGVVRAGKSSASYRIDGRRVDTPANDLFADVRLVDVPGVGPFEVYPNRDSLEYIDLYALRGAKTMLRGTIRNPGWCRTWKTMVDLGMLDDHKHDFKGKTYADFMAFLIPDAKPETIRADLAAHLGASEDIEPIRRFEWLGLFGSDPLPLEKGSPREIITERLAEKLQYSNGERDMILLFNELEAVYPAQKRREKIISSLVAYGVPGGDSAMARTVSLPAAIGVRLIAEKRVDFIGVHIPISSEIYDPVLEELEKMDDGIRFSERREEIKEV